MTNPTAPEQSVPAAGFAGSSVPLHLYETPMGASRFDHM
jgi:hypothetical protein